jgi:hypothetical protein
MLVEMNQIIMKDLIIITVTSDISNISKTKSVLMLKSMLMLIVVLMDVLN